MPQSMMRSGMVSCHLLLAMKIPFEAHQYLKTSAYSWCISSFRLALAFISACLPGPSRKQIILLLHLPLAATLSFKFLLIHDLSYMVCLLICLLFNLGSIVLQYILSSSSHLTSDMFSSNVPLSGTTKNLHGYCLSLCIIITLHTTNSEINEFLYAHKITF